MPESHEAHEADEADALEVLDYNAESWVQAELLRALHPPLRPYASGIYQGLLLGLSHMQHNHAPIGAYDHYVVWLGNTHPTWTRAGVEELLRLVQGCRTSSDVDVMLAGFGAPGTNSAWRVLPEDIGQ